jgi:hypothetical protein
MIDKNRGAEEDVKTRIGKTSNAFNMISKIWQSRHLSTKTEVRIFQHYCHNHFTLWSKDRKRTKGIVQKLQVFVNV